MQNNTNNVDLNENLDKLKTALEELQNLKNQKNINIVDATGIGRQEVKHSHFLAWLLSPDEPHKLGNNVLIGLCGKLYDYKTNGDQYTPTPLQNKDIIGNCPLINSRVDFTQLIGKQYTVEIERDDIDILIDIADTKTVIVIENKIDTTTHDDQLEKYYNYCKNGRFGHYSNKIFIYLTPKGELPRNDSNGAYKPEWCVFDYYQIISLYREIINNHFKQVKLHYKLRLKFLLEDFINMYEDILGMNPTLHQKCEEILSDKNLAAALKAVNNYNKFSARLENVIAYCREQLPIIWQKKFPLSELIIASDSLQSFCCYTKKMEEKINDIGKKDGVVFSTDKWRCRIGTSGKNNGNVRILGEIHIVRKKDINWDCVQDKYFQENPNNVKGNTWVNDPLDKEEWRRIFENVPFWKSADANQPLSNITAKLDSALEMFCDNLKEFEDKILRL